MRLRIINVPFCCLMALAISAWAAPRQTAPGKKGFESYRLLQTRNIFDPERKPGAGEASTKAPAPSGADYAALTGIMISNEKTLAFFSGSRPDFNAVLSTDGKIAGARITRISPDSIEVERDGKRVTVSVGQTVPLDSKSVPGIAPIPASSSSSPSSTSSSSSSASSSASSASASPSVDREAVMRRMMEKRQQELK